MRSSVDGVLENVHCIEIIVLYYLNIFSLISANDNKEHIGRNSQVVLPLLLLVSASNELP